MSTTTEQAYAVHPELSIDPKPVISPDEIQAMPAESQRRGREFACYKVPAASMSGDYTVTVNTKTHTLYCTCEAARHGTPCKHLASVLFKRAYEQAYRLYSDLSLPELEERMRDYIEIERFAKAETRAWRAIVSAVGDLIWERTEGIA
jgi:hypothetical protein